MDVSKKRKTEENGAVLEQNDPQQEQTLTVEDARKFLEPFKHDQLLALLQDAVVKHPDVLLAARALADSDVTRRKLFVRGLGPETSTESLKGLFSVYGELDEAVVISDKMSGKSKGYGFVTFSHVDSALLALRNPSKKIDGRMTVTHLASAGRGLNSEDQATRKIYVGNVPYEVTAERLLEFFEQFGEVEEGPLGFDKQGGKTRGFAFFVYKTEEGARMSLMEPMKSIDGNPVTCKLAEDGKKVKVGGVVSNVGGEMGGGDRMGHNPMAPSQYGPPPPYANYQLGPNSGMGVAPQGPPPVAAGGYTAQGGGPYSQGSQFTAPVTGDYNSYRMPPQSSMGMPPSGQYQEPSGYGPPPSSGYMQNHPPPSQGPPQGPPGGLYQRMPPSYY